MRRIQFLRMQRKGKDTILNISDLSILNKLKASNRKRTHHHKLVNLIRSLEEILGLMIIQFMMNELKRI